MDEDLERFENCDLYEDMYTVEKILEKKKYKNIWKYKIKWVGYSYSECTWEPIENLESCKDLLDEFENQLKNKKSKNKFNSTNPEKEINTSITSMEIDEIQESNDVNNIEIEVIEGNLEDNDPLIIKSAKIINDTLTEFELNCLVKWKRNNNGISPKSTWISSNIIRKKNPELLLKYYESKVKLPKSEISI